MRVKRRWEMRILALLLAIVMLASCGAESVIEPETEEMQTGTEPVISEPESEEESEETGTVLDKSWAEELWPGWKEVSYPALKDDPDKMQAFLEEQGQTGKEPFLLPLDNFTLEAIGELDSIPMPYYAVGLDLVMYASERQLVYQSLFQSGNAPYAGIPVGVLEKGEAVHVTYIGSYPEDPTVYYFGIDESLGSPFEDDYLAILSEVRNEVTEDGKEAIVGFACSLTFVPPDYDAEKASEEAWANEGELYDLYNFSFETDKAWIDSFFPDWKDFAVIAGQDGAYAVEEALIEKNPGLRPSHPTSEDAEAMAFLETGLDVMMYAAERQIVYRSIADYLKTPRMEPYCGIMVGALEKGEPVHVVAIGINRFRPQDGLIYYIDDGIWTAFLDGHIEALQDQPNVPKTAYGTALHLSFTPPED